MSSNDNERHFNSQRYFRKQAVTHYIEGGEVQVQPMFNTGLLPILYLSLSIILSLLVWQVWFHRIIIPIPVAVALIDKGEVSLESAGHHRTLLARSGSTTVLDQVPHQATLLQAGARIRTKVISVERSIPASTFPAEVHESLPLDWEAVDMVHIIAETPIQENALEPSILYSGALTLVSLLGR